MATRGRPKRKRKPGAGTGVKVTPHARSPRGPNSSGGKRKPPVRVDPYVRGKPKRSNKKGSSKSIAKPKKINRRRKKK